MRAANDCLRALSAMKKITRTRRTVVAVAGQPRSIHEFVDVGFSDLGQAGWCEAFVNEVLEFAGEEFS